MRIHSLGVLAALTIGASSLAGMIGLSGPETPSPRPYALGVCPISGEPLGSMGEPVVKTYDGREVRFCCKNCVGKFEADSEAGWAKVDEQIKAEQRMHYPVGTCIVSDEPLREDGEDIATEIVYDNRLVRLCCKMCRREFNESPAELSAKLDEKIADAQRAGYPMKTCVVGGGELGSMGEPFELVFANRLVRLCCDGCLEKFHASPLKYMAAIDEAYAASQRESYPLEECVVSGMELGSMGKPAELVAGTTLVRFCCDGCFGDFKDDPAKYLAKIEQARE